MSHPQKHTLVRISLRSMLAITFGVAVVMAVAGPYLRGLGAERHWHLLYTLLLIGAGMLIATTVIVRRRSCLGQECGPLLIALELQSDRGKQWGRWSWILFTLPMTIGISYFLQWNAFSTSSKWFVCVFWILPVVYGCSVASQGITAWAEDANAINFCENGILIASGFLPWNSPVVRHMDWNLSEEKLMLNINRFHFAVLVPPENREAVDAILENYYRPSRSSKP